MTERDLFIAALQQDDPAERSAFLAKACAGDVALRERIEHLLGLHDEAGSFLNPPVEGAAAAAQTPGEANATANFEAPADDAGGVVAGRYKLLQEIGEGGMGSVWMAEQVQPVKRLVALKLIKPGMDSKAVLARFEAERQALALMDHPNIAKVLDGGTTDAGRPYFVMELVKGIPLTQYCDERQLTVRQRLDLFVQVCSAVQHAHQKGIIHRDLKPSNVLVTEHDGTPMPKVIDFGLAKALHHQHALTEHTLYTAFGTVVGTPLYMAPEQVALNALDVDTRTDIYALGVILYELLTGTTPLEKKQFADAAWEEIRRLIREEEPPRPSTRLSTSAALVNIAAQRQVEPAKLGKIVRGELDWIVMRALEKDRNRRYSTANAFARDVQRYLADEPVEACPPSAGYRVRKFVRKHQASLAAAAAFAVLLVAGVAVSAWQAVRATRAEAAATQERDSARAAETQARKEAAKAEAVSNFLLTDTLAALGPSGGLGRKITVEQVLAKAAAKVGPAFRGQPELEAAIRNLIGTTFESLSLYDAGYPQLVSAVEIRNRVLGEEHPYTLASMHALAGLLSFQAKEGEAERLSRQVLQARLRVLGAEHQDTIRSMCQLVFILRFQLKFAEAEPVIREAVATSRRVFGDEHEVTREAVAGLAGHLQWQGKLDDAEPLLRNLFEMARRLKGEEDPDTFERMHDLAYLLQQQGKLPEAERVYRTFLDNGRRVLGDEHHLTLLTIRNLATVLRGQGNLNDAEPLAREALTRLRQVVGVQHNNTVEATYMLAEILRLQDRLADAEPLYRDVVEIRRKSPPAEVWPDLVLALTTLASVHEAKGELAQAEALLREIIEIRRGSHPVGYAQVADALTALGVSLLRQQKHGDAEPILRELLGICEKNLPDGWHYSNARSLLGKSLAGQKKYAEAEPLMVQGYEGLKQRAAMAPAGNAFRQSEALAWLVQLYEAWGKPDEAAKWRKELDATMSAGRETPRPLR